MNFEILILESKANELLSVCNLVDAVKIIDVVIMPTVGSEGDIAFWQQVKKFLIDKHPVHI